MTPNRRLAALAIATAVLLLPALRPSPAAASAYRDAQLGISVDLGDSWDAVVNAKAPLSRAYPEVWLSFARPGAAAWFLWFKGDPSALPDAERQRDLAASVLADRVKEAGETFLPGTFRSAEFGRAKGILLEYEAAPASGAGRTRAGRAILAVGGKEHLFLLVAEAPARGATADLLREMERFVLSFRWDPAKPAAGPAAGAGAVEGEVPTLLSGDPLPEAEFRNAVEIQKVATLPSGLEVFRQFYLFEGGKLPPCFTHLAGKELDMGGKRMRAPDLVLLIFNNRKGTAAAQLRAEVEIPGFAGAVSRTVAVPAGETFVATLTPVFSDAFFDLQEQRPGAVRLRLFEPSAAAPSLLDRVLKRPPERTVFEETQRVLLLSHNDFFWMDRTGRSLAPSIAAFVTPHDAGRRIDGLLRRAAELSPFHAILGYQEFGKRPRAEIVEGQMEAVYRAVAESGFRYVNAPFSVDGRAQRIKLPAETLADHGGNCIEISVLLASAFEAMGMRTAILLYPSHAEVAVRAWEDDDSLLVVEGTMCGSAPYAEARRKGTETFRQAQAGGKPAEVLDIAALRKAGFTPMPR